ncbi:MAG: SRPBCC family protein [Betaproteobacteria bacterium]|nr:SRPBCC family protein [Betaproteobacteria bacterium]
MRLAVRPVLFALALAILPAAAHAVAPDSRGIAVAIHRDGEAYVVDVDLTVDATPQEAWNVLTDYDHMSEFVSNLTMSHIVRRASDSLEVAQTSRVKFGLFDFKFDNVREIELVPPQEIRSKLVRGDMKMSAFTTRVAAEGNATRITNHGRFIPDRWIPPLIGTMVLEAETRKQFAELRAEILRRKDSGHTSTR